MKLIRELLEYCDARGLLTEEQYGELASLCASVPDDARDDYHYLDDCDYESWELLRPNYGEEERYRKAMIEQGGDPAPVDPTTRRGKHGSARRAPPEAGVRAKSGSLMKLPALGIWLTARFGELLTARERVLEPVFLVHQAAGLSSAMECGAKDWAYFEKVIRDLNRLGQNAFARAFEEALCVRSKSCLSLNDVCRYICDDSEMELPDVHGPAINAYRLLTRLCRQDPPIKLRWVLRNSVVDVVHQHRMVKFRMLDALTMLWKDKWDMLEKLCLKSVAPLKKGTDWFSLAQYKDMIAMEMLAILWEGERILSGSDGSHPLFAYSKSYFSRPRLFHGYSWAMALLVDKKAALALLTRPENG